MKRKGAKSAARQLPAKLRTALVETPEQFDFFATMRTLEARNSDAPRIGDSETLRDEYITLGQDPYLVFPDSNLSKVEEITADRRRVLVRFLGMLGPQGALPLATTDEANIYLSRGDDAFPRFLDLFNNRFLQLFFRAWADSRPIAQADRPKEDRFRAYIGSTIGIGSPLAVEIDSVPDAIKLHFAGLMASNAKSASRIASLISGTFHIRCDVEEFIGSWLSLAPQDQSRLGVENASLVSTGPQLGGTLMLGKSTFSISDKFRIRLFATTLAEYETYLPGNIRAENLDDLITFHLGETLDWDVELALPASQARPMVLGRSGRLGWTSWMAPDWAEDGETIRCDARFHVHSRVKEHRVEKHATGKAGSSHS